MEIPIAATAVALGAGGLLAGGLLAGRLRAGAWIAQIFAGGLMLALVAVDLIPDAVRQASSAGWPVYLVAAVFCLIALPAHLALRPRSDDGPPTGCCSPASGRLSSVGIAVHGGLEGMVLGLGLGLDSAAGPVLLCAFCLHKFGEGFALRVALRTAGSGPRQVRRWMALAAAAPVLGAVAGSTVSLDDRVAPLLTTALAAVLTAVAVSLLRPLTAASVGYSAATSTPSVTAPALPAGLLRSWLSLIAGIALMGVVTGVAG